MRDEDRRDAGRALNESLWEQHAEWWQREFASGTDPEYSRQVLPLVARHLRGARRVLDIGCGEGQAARRLVAQGAEVVGLDPTFAQLRQAGAAGQGLRCVRARAEALPCRTGAFDAALLCLALEHVDAFELAIHEVARVLEPGGRFLLLLSHPMLQAPGSGWIDDQTLGVHYWRVGAYLGDHTAVDTVAAGVSLRFVHRPLSRYVHAMGRSGLLVDDMEEPPPPAELLRDVWRFPEASSIPRILVVRARRVGSHLPGYDQHVATLE